MQESKITTTNTPEGADVVSPETIVSKLDHKIQLENYYGPLDLLLHLVRESELDIQQISLASIADQYISYIKAMQNLDIDLAGEFLVIASQLMLIKSRSLLPPIEEEGEEEEEDPSLDLIRKLIEYKKFKDRSRGLERLYIERAKKFGRPLTKIEHTEGEEQTVDLSNVELWDIVVMYSRLMKQIILDTSISILYKDIPLEVFIKNIMDVLASKKQASFMELIGDKNDKGKVVGTFLALLELVKEQKIRADQPDNSSDIKVWLAG